MAEKRTIRLRTAELRQRAISFITRCPDDWVMTLAPPTRSGEQNAKLWAMLEDCQNQIPDMANMDKDDIKLRFMDALGEEVRYLPKLGGSGYFPVGHKSSSLSKSQFSMLIELIYAEGARHGVVWSEAYEHL